LSNILPLFYDLITLLQNPAEFTSKKPSINHISHSLLPFTLHFLIPMSIIITNKIGIPKLFWRLNLYNGLISYTVKKKYLPKNTGIMVYFLNDVEHKYIVMNLRPKIRANPVPEELRGWNWHSPPLKPYYDVKLPMYLVCSSYCKTARDVYLTMVEGKKGEEDFNISLGKAVHEAIAGAIREAKKLNFDAEPPEQENETIQCAVNLVWDYTISACKSSFLKAKAEQPYASEEDVIATSIPFLVEHRMDGTLLGCSGIIAVDCYDYLRNIVFDVKLSSSKNMRLYTTGYALVIESLYEIPVDIGCTVSVSFKKDRLALSKDIYYIDANLRNWWIEERDKKAEIVYNQVDPGKPDECNPKCMFRSICL